MRSEPSTRRLVALAWAALALGCTFDDWTYAPLAGPPRVAGGVTSAGAHGASRLRVRGGFEAPARRCNGRWCVTGSVAP